MKKENLTLGSSSCILGPERHNEEGFSTYRDAGIKYAEFSCCHNLNQIGFYENPEKIYLAAKENGVEFTSFHLPFSKNISFSNPDKETRLLAEEKLKKTMDVAKSIGIKLMVMHPSCSNYEFYPERKPLFEQCMHHIGNMYEYAEKTGVTLAVENMTGKGLLGIPEEMIPCLKEFPNLKMCFDTNHCKHLLPEEYLDALINENMKGRIAAVHISDYHLKEEEHLLPGEGEIKWDKITDKLFALDFKGIFMYEPGVKKETGERYSAKEVADNFINVILQK